MRQGQTPIHIMRWAPADFVNDAFVKVLVARRDSTTFQFYVLALNWSHIEGGDLPADPEVLAAILGMAIKDVRKALPICLEAGKLQEADGRLFHHRVRRQVEDELAFRAEQADRGRKGGRSRWGADGHNNKDSGGHGDGLAPAIQPTEDSPKPAVAVRQAPSAIRQAPAPLADATPPATKPASPLDEDGRMDYGRTVWEAWVEKRGGPGGPEMSTAEWSHILRWLDGGIPLRIVLRGITDCSKPSGGKRTPLSYVVPAVDEAIQRWVRSQTA